MRVEPQIGDIYFIVDEFGDAIGHALVTANVGTRRHPSYNIVWLEGGRTDRLGFNADEWVYRKVA